jgi:hypothetical protein
MNSGLGYKSQILDLICDCLILLQVQALEMYAQKRKSYLLCSDESLNFFFMQSKV